MSNSNAVKYGYNSRLENADKTQLKTKKVVVFCLVSWVITVYHDYSWDMALALPYQTKLDT